jgi:outer membrane protein
MLRAAVNGRRRAIQKADMLRITIHDSSVGTTFKLEGKLAGAWVGELEQCWITANSTLHDRKLAVDLRQVSFIDADGKGLLERMCAAGAELVATGPLTKSICEEARQRGCRNLKAVLLALLLASTLCLRAQPQSQAQPPSEPLKLTLRDAVQMALKQNPQVQIAALTLAQTNQEERLARSGLLPQVNFQTIERVERTNAEALFGRPFPGIPQHIGPFENFQTGPYFSGPVFDLTLWRRWRASKENVKASGAQVQTVREQYAALVVSQYLGSLRSAATVKAAQSRVDLAQALFKQASDLQQAGVGTGIDTLRANVELQNETQNLIVAQTNLETSLYGVTRLLNIDPAQPIELSDTVSFFQTPAIEVDRSLQTAYNNRPEMQALRAQGQALELQRQAVRAQRLPSGRFNGFWTYLGLSPASAIPSYTYEGTLSIPLFTGGRIGAELARAEIEQRRNSQQQQEQRNAIALEVRTAIAQLEAAQHQVDVANLGVNLANEEVVQARDRFQAGVASNIEVVQAQDALARANDNQIFALYRYNQARADLAHATGQMQNLYAK